MMAPYGKPCFSTGLTFLQRPWVSSPRYRLALSLLISARTEAGITQRDMAERLGKPRSFVSKVESRERRVDFVEFVEWAQALHVSPELLIAEVARALTTHEP